MSKNKNGESKFSEVLERYENELVTGWVGEQVAAVTLRSDLMNESELREQSCEFLRLVREAARDGNMTDITGPEWIPVREMLTKVSETRAKQGFSPSETATFVFSLKQPLFTRLRAECAKDDSLMSEVWSATILTDKLGLFTTEAYQKTREAIISNQQKEMLELSTPVIKLWEGVLVVPLIGTLDSQRTQTVMENLLKRIVETSARVAIMDITGVPTVDTLVAQHLLKTVGATRLMGTECIISGIRPEIAQTMIHLGVPMENVITKATMADAIGLALERAGYTVARREQQPA